MKKRKEQKVTRNTAGIAEFSYEEEVRVNEKEQNVRGITRVLRPRNSAVVVYLRGRSPSDKTKKKKKQKSPRKPLVLKSDRRTVMKPKKLKWSVMAGAKDSIRAQYDRGVIYA